MAIASATDDRITVVTRDKGQKGDTGTAGLDGQGFNGVRQSLLDAPLCRLFTPNKLVDTLAGSLTATRATTASYVDRYGVVKYKGGNTATNLLTYSEQFDNVAWQLVGSSNLSVTSDSIIAPDGSNTADTLTSSTSDSNGIFNQTNVPNDNQTYTASFFVKADTVNNVRIRLRFFNGGSATEENAFFDLQSGSTSSGQIASIVPLSDGWFRISCRASNNATGNVSAQSFIYSDQQIGDFYVWGAQLEQSRAANGYLKTEASTITSPTNSTFGVETVREEAKGWLIEGASTNLLTYSEQFDNAAWSKTRCTITENASTAPDGTNTANEIVTTSSGSCYINQNYTGTAGEAITISAFYKNVNASDSAYIRVDGTTVSFQFDGTPISVPSTYSLSVKLLSDGWVRVAVTRTLSATGGIGLQIGVIASNVGEKLYVWGAQIEELPFASSYIPTTTSAATRAKDIVQAQGVNNLGRPSDSFSVFFKKSVIAVDSLFFSRVITTENDQDPTKRFRVFFDDSTDEVNFDNGSIRVNTQGAKSPSNSICVIYNAFTGTQYIFVDGILTDTSTIGSASSAIQNTLEFGGTDVVGSGQSLFTNLADFRIYDFALNADEAAYLAGVK